MKRILIIEDTSIQETVRKIPPGADFIAWLNSLLLDADGNSQGIRVIDECDSQGAILVMEERMRQQREGNWTDQHDDTHDPEFSMPPKEQFPLKEDEYYSPVGFPFEEPWRKIKARVDNMRRSGAFIAAELDRLLRKAGG